MLRESLGPTLVQREVNNGFGSAAAAGFASVAARQPACPTTSSMGMAPARRQCARPSRAWSDCCRRRTSTRIRCPRPEFSAARPPTPLVGVSIDGDGRRVTGLEQREHDQGQHDGVRDVLAVSSAGMLIRQDVWEELAGFDPHLPLYRDDVDFCWRVHRAGGRVLVAADAVLHHRETSAHGRRQVRDGVPSAPDREAAIRVL